MNSVFSLGILGDWVNSVFQSIMLWLDSVIYWFAAQCYQLFIRLSMTKLFSDSFFQDFANRIYSILGVFMLFYLAYALLNALVDPERLTKGDKSVSKLATNLIVSLVILGFLPSIFDYAYRLQNYILSSNTIGALIFGGSTIDPSAESDSAMIRYGDAISYTLLNTFVNPDNYNVRLSNDLTWDDARRQILEDGVYSGITGLANPIVYGATDLDDGKDVDVTYHVGLSTVAGIYLCYIMLSFTLDLGVRVAKLAFCQLIAPIPVIMRVVPGKKGTFDKWLKLTLTVYFEVFVRVAMMYLSIYFINALVNNESLFDDFFNGDIQGMLAFVIVILGILTFAKQAPKMIGEIFGIDSGNLKLGIGDKLKGNFLGKGISAIGAGALGFVTGGVGAGIAGLANGAGASGFMFGAANGWKNKGMQFTNQKQELYSKLTGDYKGTAGLFGTTSMGTKLNNYMTGVASNQSKKNREYEMQQFENEQIRQENIRRKQDFESKREQELEAMRTTFNARQTEYREQREQELRSLREQLHEETDAFNADKEQRKERLRREMAPENYVAGVSRPKEVIQSELDNLEKETSNQAMRDIANKISSLQSQNFADTEEGKTLVANINSIQNQQYQYMSSAEEEQFRIELQKRYDKSMDDLDNKSAHTILRENKDIRRYHAHVVNSDRLGEAKSTKAQKEAFESVLKDLGYKKEDKK